MSESIQKYSKVIADINLDNLVYNLEQIRKQVSPAVVMGVVKADAYGHGVIPVAKTLEKAGVSFFAVARIKEALELKQAGISGKILIFGRLEPTDIKVAIDNNFRFTLTNLRDLTVIDKIAEISGKRAIIHINIDSGMGRVGIFPKEVDSLITGIKETQNIEFEGIYSHFSTSDTRDKAFALQQFETFLQLLRKFSDHQINFPVIHMANSGAILDLPDAYKNMFNCVRAGIILYGCYPSVETTESVEIKPVMTVKTKVLEIREMEPNRPVSYGLRYYTKEKTGIAVLPIGYADGISRIFTNKGKVMINGKLYPIVGTVTMDQIMVAVDNDVNEGDEVIFWGNDNHKILKPSDVADWVGTISYELCTSITKRVLKIYKTKQ